MYHNNYVAPDNTNYMYENSSSMYPTAQSGNDDRFILPFIVGGVAGTALGYGIANNNQNGQVFYPYPPYYYPPYYGGMQPQPYPIYYS